ncbi:MAG: carboxypeptidase regulatory-like domain-containing protein, partial [Verrucomicrobium sp.]
MFWRPRLVILSLLAFAFDSHGAEISGTVKLAAGGIPSNATLLIQSARMRTGDSPICPTCWRDCNRTANTDKDGSFRIADVDDNLIYRLLVVADGSAPLLVSKVDPLQGSTQVTLPIRDLKSIPESHKIKGKVLSSAGKPLPGAVVTPLSTSSGLDATAVTDLKGEFVLCSSSPVEKSPLQITAPGHAGTWVEAPNKEVSSDRVTVTMRQGASVTGRVLMNGNPVVGRRIAIVQTDRSIDVFLGPIETVTDAEGRFTLEHLPAAQELVFYGIMESLEALGFVQSKILEPIANAAGRDLGDLQVQPAVALKGRLIRKDGKPFLAGTRIHLSRDPTWDSRLVDVQLDGSFESRGLPRGEALSLSSPNNVDYISSTYGGEVHPNRRGVSFNLTGDITDLTVQAEWKDASTRKKEAAMDMVKSRFADYFKEARLGVEQKAALLEIFCERQLEMMRHDSNDPAGYLKRKYEVYRPYQSRIVDLLQPAGVQDLTDWEDRESGAQMAQFLVKSQASDWLTPEETRASSIAMGRVLRGIEEYHANRTTTAPMTKEEIEQVLNRVEQENEAALIQILPSAKHEALKKAL